MHLLYEFRVKQFLLGVQATDELIMEVKKVIKKVKPEFLSYRLELIKELKIDKIKVNQEVVYIQADNDKLVPTSCLKAFQDRFSSVQLVKIKGPHFLLQTQPKECAKIVNEVLC